tara:strand:- start:559 stop:819 length:261 start_codon:yes stop_codon:yes gene_type:complete
MGVIKRVKIMRFFFLAVFTILIGLTSGVAMADEFGERFYNQAPQALGDYTMAASEIPDIAMDDMAQDLQNIMPAAGEEDLDGPSEE